MRNYELTYLLSSDLSEDEARQFQNKISSSIQEEGGILGEGNVFLKRRLAYPVKKTVQAYLISQNFKLNQEKLVNWEKKIKTENQILRFILTIKRERRFVPPRRRLSPVSEKTPLKVRTEKKVELKEIEKKLDEILLE